MKSTSLFIVFIFVISLFKSIEMRATCEYSAKLKADDFAMGNLLNWATINEENQKEFIIERSDDGLTFEKIGSVEAQGGADELEYTFLDVSASQGRSYYRLKSVNIDETFDYSSVAIANMSLKNDFTVISLSPPSSNGKLEMVINSKKVNEIQYEIRDLENKVYYTSKQALNNGINVLTINISEELLEEGRVFRIAIQGEGENEVLTFKSDGY